MENYYSDIEENISCPTELGRILGRMVSDGAIGQHIDSLLQEIVERRPKHLAGTNVSEMALHRRPSFTLYARRVGGEADFVSEVSGTHKYLRTNGRDCVVVLGISNPVLVRTYRAVDGGSRLLETGEYRYDGRVIFEALNSDEVQDYLVENGTAWMIRLNFGPCASDIQFYHRETLALAFSAAAQGELSSLVTLCQVFAASEDPATLPYLSDLSKSQAHFVRWAAIQATGNIDAARAREMLSEALNDNHPAIRTAAARALEGAGHSHG